MEIGFEPMVGRHGPMGQAMDSNLNNFLFFTDLNLSIIDEKVTHDGMQLNNFFALIRWESINANANFEVFISNLMNPGQAFEKFERTNKRSRHK